LRLLGGSGWQGAGGCQGCKAVLVSVWTVRILDQDRILSMFILLSDKQIKSYDSVIIKIVYGKRKKKFGIILYLTTL